MTDTRHSGQTPSQSRNGRPDRKPRKKSRSAFIMLLALLPILTISGVALSVYLGRPPELPPPEKGETGAINEGQTKGTDGRTGGSSLEPTEGTESSENKTEEKPKPPKNFKENFYTFVLTGIDYEGYHSDTIMVVSLDTAAKKVNLISVPRDSQVDVPREYKKINAAYAYGGTKELKRELESILGFAPQYDIRVDLEAFPKLVDAVGGVEFNVPQNMNMDDDSQNLHIHLVKGPQLLDGDKALQLVRFRGYPSADLGRMQTQQKFLKALAKKAMSPANILKINTFIDIFKQDVKTDLGLRDIQWFAKQVIKLDPETDITVQTLPHIDDGNYKGQNYLFLSPEGVVEMVNRTVNPYTTDITLEDINIIRIEDGDINLEDITYEESPYGMVRNCEILY